MSSKHPKATQPPTAQAQSQHTPGPWTPKGHVWQHNLDCWTRPVYTADHRVAQTAMALTRDECEANARLIAAAPEMLEALVGLMEAWDGAKSLLDLSERIPAIRAAIAKATQPENGGGK